MDIASILGLTAGELISPSTAAYIMCALGLAVHFGYTGLLNFGQAAFAALGAYGYAIGVLTFGFDWWQAAILGAIFSIAFAVILGIPTLRLRADYLAIVTIAAAQALNYIFSSSEFADVTGGSAGLMSFADSFYALNPIPVGRYPVGPIDLGEKEIFIRLVGFGLVAVFAIVMLLLLRSPWGRVLKGIREDEDAVRSLGKNVFTYKIQSLIIGGVFAAFGGMIFVLAPETNQPSTWSSGFTFMIWTVLLLGGAATVFGPIIGGMIFFAILMFTQVSLNTLVDNGVLTFMTTAQAAQFRSLLVGLALMLLVIYRPQGIFGNKKETLVNAR